MVKKTERTYDSMVHVYNEFHYIDVKLITLINKDLLTYSLQMSPLPIVKSKKAAHGRVVVWPLVPSWIDRSQ